MWLLRLHSHVIQYLCEGPPPQGGELAVTCMVYQIPCQCGKVYVGEMQRHPAETRVKEHRDACKKGDTWKSAIAEHQLDQQYQVDWDGTRVLDRATWPIHLN